MQNQGKQKGCREGQCDGCDERPAEWGIETETERELTDASETGEGQNQVDASSGERWEEEAAVMVRKSKEVRYNAARAKTRRARPEGGCEAVGVRGAVRGTEICRSGGAGRAAGVTLLP